MKHFVENWNEDNLKQIGAKVPREFAEMFSEHCRKEKFNQRQLFYNLTKWWLEHNVIIQEHICKGRWDMAISGICEFQDGRVDESAVAIDSKEKKRKTARRKPSKSA